MTYLTGAFWSQLCIIVVNSFNFPWGDGVELREGGSLGWWKESGWWEESGVVVFCAYLSGRIEAAALM